MARLVPLPAVLDADVLHPPGIRDVLLSVAEQGLYRPVWTPRILGEMSDSIREAARSRQLPEPDTGHIEAEMRAAFPDAEFAARGYERREQEMTNHPKDRHVLAAAVVAKAGIIVSEDRRGFARAACEVHGVRRLSAEAFLLELLRRYPDEFVAALEAIAARRRRPPNTVPTILDALAENRPRLSTAARSAYERRRRP